MDGEACRLHGFSDDSSTLIVSTSRPSTLVLQWTDPFASVNNGPGALSDLDFFAFDIATNNITAQSATVNIGLDPVEILTLPSAGDHGLLICLFEGPPPALLKFIDIGDALISSSLSLDSPTNFGHANAASVAGVGAVNFQSIAPPILESFSSRGGIPILFDRNGNRQSEVVRNQPRFTAVDGVSTTFFPPGGFFFGTSAAAPNAAAAAALLLQVDNTLSAEQVYDILGSTAVDMLEPGFDFDSGDGLINAFAAVDSIFVEVVAPSDDCFGSNIPIVGFLFEIFCFIIGLFGS